MRWLASVIGDQEVIIHLCSSDTTANSSSPFQAVNLSRGGKPAEWERDNFMQRGRSSGTLVIAFHPSETTTDVRGGKAFSVDQVNPRSWLAHHILS